MEKVYQLGDVFVHPLQNVSSQVFSFLPQVVSAIIVLIVGCIVVRVLVSVLSKLLALLKLDALMEKTGVSKELKGIGIKASISDILVKVVKIFLGLIVLITIVDILNVKQLSEFLDKIVTYLPNIFVSVVILAIGVMFANIIQAVVEGTIGSVKAAKESAKTGGKIAKIAILAFTIMATLVQLGIAEELIGTLFSAIVYAIALALGLSFGLGGKDAAQKWLEHWQK
ncbi:MAG TPA: hypothetical protein VIT68_01475 [Candidatus Gracilibacteria bacterium]